MNEERFVLAPIGKRFTAQFIDETIAVGVGYCVLLALNAVLSDDSSLPTLALLAIALLYTLLADGMFDGQSIGKKIMNLYVVCTDTDGPCTYIQSIVRNVTYILGIFDLIFILGSERRRLGDRLASTRVMMKITH